METNRQLPVSTHFYLDQLAEGVYAAIHKAGGGAICNAGIVDLGDRTLVFDTFVAPLPAQDLRAAAEALTGRPVSTVIDSHDHNDHTWGNQAFDEATQVLSTEQTRGLIVASQAAGDYDSLLANVEATLQTTRARFEEATDEAQRQELALWVDEYQSIADAKPVLRVRVPNVTFTRRMSFHGTARAAELIELAGHTASDVVLWLPQDGIAFLSDLLFVGCHPYLGDGDPEAMLRSLDTVAGLGPRLVVPGHGPTGKPESLALMSHYVRTLNEIARRMVEAEETEGRIDALAIPPPFDGWQIASFFRANLHFLYQHHLRSRGR